MFCFLQGRAAEQVRESSTEKKVSKTSVSKSSSNEQNVSGQTPVFLPADVTNEQQIQDMFSKVKDQYGRLDAVLNCAGIGVAFRTYNINKVKQEICFQ